MKNILVSIFCSFFFGLLGAIVALNMSNWGIIKTTGLVLTDKNGTERFRFSVLSEEFENPKSNRSHLFITEESGNKIFELLNHGGWGTSLDISPPQDLKSYDKNLSLIAYPDLTRINLRTESNYGGSSIFTAKDHSGIDLNANVFLGKDKLPNHYDVVQINPKWMSFSRHLSQHDDIVSEETSRVKEWKSFDLNIDYEKGASMKFYSDENTARLQLGTTELTNADGNTVMTSPGNISIFDTKGFIKWKAP